MFPPLDGFPNRFFLRHGGDLLLPDGVPGRGPRRQRRALERHPYPARTRGFQLNRLAQRSAFRLTRFTAPAMLCVMQLGNVVTDTIACRTAIMSSANVISMICVVGLSQPSRL